MANMLLACACTASKPAASWHEVRTLQMADLHNAGKHEGQVLMDAQVAEEMHGTQAKYGLSIATQ